MRIKAFNNVWWTLLALNIFIFINLKLSFNNLTIQARNSYILYMSLAVCLYFIIYRIQILRKFEYKSDDFYNYLPFYPCNILTFILPLTILFHSSYFEATTMLFGTTFPLLAILMPTDDVADLPFFSVEGTGFYFAHYGMWITSLLYTSFVKPDSLFWINRAIVVFVSIMLLEHLINLYLRKTRKYTKANFGFTCDRENNPVFEALYKLVPYDFFYIWPLIPVFVLIGLFINFILSL